MNKLKKLMSGLLTILLLTSSCIIASADNNSNWNTMYDFEELTAVPSYVSKGNAKSISSTQVPTATPNYLNKESTKCIGIYVDSGILNPPLSSGTPISVTLDSTKMQSATGIRVSFGMTYNLNNTKGLYYGVYYNNEYYYKSISYNLYNDTFNYLYFVGQEFTNFTDQTSTITIDESNLKNVTNVCIWTYASGALTSYIDDIEYTTEPGNGVESYSKLELNIMKSKPITTTRSYSNDTGKENIAMFLVIGQSNFTTGVGYNHEISPVESGKMSDYSAEITMPDKGTVYSSTAGNSITALNDSTDATSLISTNGEAKSLSGFSPAFAKEWYEKTGEKVVLVQCAVGATCMHLWVPDTENYTCKCGRTTNYLEKAINCYETSYNALCSKYNIVHSGYLWNQGENDQSYDIVGSSTICSAQTYYEAYMSMHQKLMDTGLLDFGGIVPVRNRSGNACSATATSVYAREVTYARAAQYYICNNIDNIFMISRVFEQATGDQMLASDYYIHCLQSTYNICGKDAADNLIDALYINGNEPKFTGLEVYDSKGSLVCKFDRYGNIVEGEKLFALHTTKYTSQLQFALMPGSGGYTLTTSVDGSSQYINEFSYIDWDALHSNSISMVEFKLQNYGDVNNDSNINVLDLLLIKRYLANLDTTISINADVNVDNVVDIKDMILLSKYLANYNIKLG